MKMESIPEKLHNLFSGLSRAHGQYRMTGKVSGKGKKDGYGNTIRGSATVELWERHLAGTYGLGIVPIREDNTCRFGAIDIDKYDKDLEVLAAQIEKLELPLVVCRSKSGGAHLFLFCREDVPALLVRTKLMEWAVAIGHSGVEVFPKQVSLAGPEDVGNWINMPYYEGDKTNRFAFFGGERLSIEKFIEVATLMSVTEESLEDTEVANEASNGAGEAFFNGPPCLQTLSARGFEEGARNASLFSIAVYLRKRYGDDDWSEHLDAYNQKFLKPPLGHKEVAQVMKNVSRKAYSYKCNDPPINAVCNRQICLTRQYGIGVQDGDPGVVFGTLVKINSDPPSWIWDVNGARIALTTQELKDQARFHARSMEAINIWPSPIKPGQWQELVRNKLNNVEVVEAPPEASRAGQMWIHLQNYLQNQPHAKHRDEMLHRKPWTSEGRTYFSASEFKKYLERERFNCTERDIWNWLGGRKAEHGFFNIKGRGLNWWSIPAFGEQSEDFEVPSILDGEEPM